jgi:aspartate racemase
MAFMKTLGLLGGMSWESTSLYYQHLNRLTRERLGGRHSARLLIWSADFAQIADLQSAGDWDAAAGILLDAGRALERAGAQALMICANTMHRMAPQVQAAVDIPLLHVADAVSAAIRRAGARRPLLLATRFTMEQDFYVERLRRGGVEAMIPPRKARDRLHAIIFDELVQGRFEPDSRAEIIAVVEAAITRGADAVILGCTEFALLVGPGDWPVPTFDTTELHARAGLAFAFAD